MKKQKGITLIALVVTIVVLLILAGVALNLVLGDNGIITRAKQAKLEHEKASTNDIETMNAYEDYIINSGEILTPTDQKYFDFTTDTTTKTATITGINEQNAYKFYWYSDSDFYKTAIKDGEKIITDIVIPSKYIDEQGVEYTITEMGYNCFTHGSDTSPEYGITSCIFPDTIKTIGAHCFRGNTFLNSVYISSSVNTIGYNAFINCSNLVDITVDQPMGSLDFSNSGLTEEQINSIKWKEFNIEEANQKYFTFTADSTTKTATITGINENYEQKSYYDSIPYVTAIKDGDKIITDVIIPSKYVDTDGTEYTVTTIGARAFARKCYL